jgi:aminoglycoside phosphotransferase (APT) family kinase protein
MSVATALGELLGEVGIEGRVSDARVTSTGLRRRRLLFNVQGERTQGYVAVVDFGGMPSDDLPLDVEVQLLRDLAAAGVPVPRVVTAAVVPALGGPTLVTEYVPGEAVPRYLLRQVARDGSGARLAQQVGTALARLHGLDAAALTAALPGQGETAAPAERALQALRRACDDLLQPSPVFVLALRSLAARMPPAPSRLRPVHGDARVGRIVGGPDGLGAVLDWERAHLGDPHEDLATFCLRTWRFGRRALGAGGLAPSAVFLDAWRAGGGAFDRGTFDWWTRLATLRRGVELAEQARAHLDGTVSDIVLAASGRHIAELEFDLLQLLEPA